MNRVLCNGKFVFKDTRTEEDEKNDKKLLEESGLNKKKKPSKSEIEKKRKAKAFNIKVKNSVFDYLKRNGYEVYDVRTGDGYFIFDMGEESVVHFKVKGRFLKNYLFGMWINYKNFLRKRPSEMSKKELDEYNKLPHDEKKEYNVCVKIFQQHEDYLDAFKPSRSGIVVNIPSDEMKDFLFASGRKRERAYCADTRCFKKLLDFMCRHPFLHFAGYLNNGDRLVRYMDEFAVMNPFLGFVMERVRFHVKKWILGVRKWIGFRKAWNTCKGLAREDCVKKVTMTAFSCIHPGFSGSCDYEISLSFTEGSTVEECSEAFDRHVKTSRFGEYDSYDCVAEIQLGREELRKDADAMDENGKHHDTYYCIDWIPRKEEHDFYDKVVEWYGNYRKYTLKSLDISKNSKDYYPNMKEYALRKMYYDIKTRKFQRSLCKWNDKTKLFDVVKCFDTETSKWVDG